MWQDRADEQGGQRSKGQGQGRAEQGGGGGGRGAPQGVKGAKQSQGAVEHTTKSPPSQEKLRIWVSARDALEGKAPQRRPRRRLGRRLEEVAKAVGGGYCRLQMPVKLALVVRETVAGHRLGALEGGGGTSPSNASLVSSP